MRALGTINAFMRGGRYVFEAIYAPSYRHNAYRVCNVGDEPAPMYATEDDARRALEGRAVVDGATIEITAGSYARRERRHGEIIPGSALYVRVATEGK